MGANIFFLVFYALWFLGFTGWWFVHFLKKYLFWRRKTPVSPGRQFVLILLPSLLTAVFLFPTFFQAFKNLPVPYSELKEATATVESIKQLTYRRTQSRYGGVRREHHYNIYLEGLTGYLRVPENFGFDQDEFLAWAGLEPVTFLYNSNSGRSVPYVIQNASGARFLDYEFTSGRLWSGAMYRLVTALSALLFLGAGAVYLPAWLYPLESKGQVGKSKKLELAFRAALVATLLVVGYFTSQPEVTQTPAGGTPPVVVEVGGGIRATLPQGWREDGTTESGTQWYKLQSGVATCFHLNTWPEELPDGEWSRLLLEDYRKFLLETYITQPQEGLGSFLTELASSGGQVPGTDFLISEGWGQSKSGVKNHFLTVFLPQARAMVVIRSCSSKKSVTWEELERYIDGCVRPLLSGLQVDAR